MKLRTILPRILAVLGILVIALAGFGVWVVYNPWPQLSGTITAPGLQAPATVYRDRWGVPHIYAENDSDLLFAQGYVHAQDRLWQMEFRRRLGSGTLGEVVGSEAVFFDRYMRTLGLRVAAEQEWELLGTDARALLQSYADGVSFYIDTHQHKLPVEFALLGFKPAPWTPLDTLTWGKVMAWNLSWNYSIEILRTRMVAQHGVEAANQMLPPYGQAPPLLVPPEVNNYPWAQAVASGDPDPIAAVLPGSFKMQGSNNWVVAGQRSASGKPLLANDTHLALSMPSTWYENGVHGGRFNSVGFTLPGVPLIIIGHNQRIAWGVTDLPSDTQDLYIEKLDNPANPTRYEFQGQWYDLEIRQETIAIKGGEPETLTVRHTRHGPLINDLSATLRNGDPVAMQWTGHRDPRLFEAVLGLNLARDWDSFRNALAGWGSPNQSFVYADVDGNIGYQAAGHFPIRSPKNQGLVPVPGWNGEYEWQGLLPFEQQFQTSNPLQGFLASANDRVAPESYPHQIGVDWGDPYRIKRISDVLSQSTRIDVEQMRVLQSDTVSLWSEALRPVVLGVAPKSDLERRALDQVRNWNLRIDLDQTGPTIFQVWYWYLLRNTLQNKLNEPLMRLYHSYMWVHIPMMVTIYTDDSQPWFIDEAQAGTDWRNEIAARSLTDAVNLLQQRLGDDPSRWTWDRIHTVTFTHEALGSTGTPLDTIFNSRKVPAPGDDLTISMGWVMTDGSFAMDGGPAQRMIVDLGDWDRSLSINSTGQSGHLWHQHSADMMDPWSKQQYRPMVSSRQQVEEAAVETLRLQP